MNREKTYVLFSLSPFLCRPTTFPSMEKNGGSWIDTVGSTKSTRRSHVGNCSLPQHLDALHTKAVMWDFLFRTKQETAWIRVSKWRNSVSTAVSAGIRRTRPNQRKKLLPLQAALWPRRFCMDFAGTFGRSKSQPWASQAAFWSEFRPKPGRRTCPTNETARDYTIT